DTRRLIGCPFAYHIPLCRSDGGRLDKGRWRRDKGRKGILGFNGFVGRGPVMRKWIWTGVTPVLGAGLVMALVGAVVGLHNPITPHAPTGCEGGLIGGALGLLLGGLVVGVSGWQDRALARWLGGAVIGAVLGLVFGLRGPGFAVPAGLLGTLAGALV